MKFKYHEQIRNLTNCPPTNYSGVEKLAFRWVRSDPQKVDFLPINQIKSPPQRVLDDSDLHCMGFGLSFFDSYQHACAKFGNILRRLRLHLQADFIAEKGDSIASISLTPMDGVASLPEDQNFGHFTFHEFEEADLLSKVVSVEKISI